MCETVWLYTNFQNHVVVCKQQQAVGSSLQWGRIQQTVLVWHNNKLKLIVILSKKIVHIVHVNLSIHPQEYLLFLLFTD